MFNYNSVIILVAGLEIQYITVTLLQYNKI